MKSFRKQMKIVLLLALIASMLVPSVANAAAKSKEVLAVSSKQMTIKSGNATLKAGKTAALTTKYGTLNSSGKYTYKTISPSSVQWTSSAPKVATVSKKGTVTAKKAGKTVITAKYKKATRKFTLTVKAASTSSSKKLALTAYKNFLKQVTAGKRDSDFSEAGSSSSAYQYFLFDIDKNGIPELIVGKEAPVDKVFLMKYCRVYTCQISNGTAKVKLLSGSSWITSVSSSGKELYQTFLSRGTGKTSVYKVKLSGGKITNTYSRTIAWADLAGFNKSNPAPAWKKTTDPSGIK